MKLKLELRSTMADEQQLCWYDVDERWSFRDSDVLFLIICFDLCFDYLFWLFVIIIMNKTKLRLYFFKVLILFDKKNRDEGAW
jgi:hypothetical protein